MSQPSHLPQLWDTPPPPQLQPPVGERPFLCSHPTNPPRGTGAGSPRRGETPTPAVPHAHMMQPKAQMSDFTEWPRFSITSGAR